jgi:hypothetical protein
VISLGSSLRSDPGLAKVESDGAGSPASRRKPTLRAVKATMNKKKRKRKKKKKKKKKKKLVKI